VIDGAWNASREFTKTDDVLGRVTVVFGTQHDDENQALQ
jgi:hypothetical protein